MKTIIGDLVTSVTSGVIFHQVNCQGVMGSGIAKQLRDAYPIIWSEYKVLCDSHHRRYRDQGAGLLGTCQLLSVTPELRIANLFGQQFYGRDGRAFTSYDALNSALTSLNLQLRELSLDGSFCHHPLIGCGLGGGNWSAVSAIIEDNLGASTTLWVLPDNK